MYKVYRDIHLVLGLILTPILLIYAISSALLAYGFIDFSKTEHTTTKFKIISPPNSLDDIQKLLKSQNIEGSLRKISHDENGNISLKVSRLGEEHILEIDEHGNATSKKSRENTTSFLKLLHITTGFEHEENKTNWWGLAALLTGFLLLALLITGIILWSYRTTEKRTGILFLSISVVYCTTVILVLRLG